MLTVNRDVLGVSSVIIEFIVAPQGISGNFGTIALVGNEDIVDVICGELLYTILMLFLTRMWHCDGDRGGGGGGGGEPGASGDGGAGEDGS